VIFRNGDPVRGWRKSNVIPDVHAALVLEVIFVFKTYFALKHSLKTKTCG
jgi:hypothetical protein